MFCGKAPLVHILRWSSLAISIYGGTRLWTIWWCKSRVLGPRRFLKTTLIKMYKLHNKLGEWNDIVLFSLCSNKQYISQLDQDKQTSTFTNSTTGNPMRLLSNLLGQQNPRIQNFRISESSRTSPNVVIRKCWTCCCWTRDFHNNYLSIFCRNQDEFLKKLELKTMMKKIILLLFWNQLEFIITVTKSVLPPPEMSSNSSYTIWGLL